MPHLTAHRVSSLDALAGTPGSGPELTYAVVRGFENGAFLVAGPAGVATASRALSCHLLPMENDRVLLAQDTHENWILAVLERPGDQEALLAFEGNVRLHAPHGDIHLLASDAIGLSSADIAMNAEKGSAVFGTVNVAAHKYDAWIGKAKTVMEKAQLFCRSMRQHLGKSYKNVDGHEEEHAASRRMIAETMSMQARTTDIKAGERVAVNTNQFHVN